MLTDNLFYNTIIVFYKLFVQSIRFTLSINIYIGYIENKTNYEENKEEQHMSKDFNNAFDNFLNERMGEAAFDLRKKNKRYDAALTELFGACSTSEKQ